MYGIYDKDNQRSLNTQRDGIILSRFTYIKCNKWSYDLRSPNVGYGALKKTIPMNTNDIDVVFSNTLTSGISLVSGLSEPRLLWCCLGLLRIA